MSSNRYDGYHPTDAEQFSALAAMTGCKSTGEYAARLRTAHIVKTKLYPHLDPELDAPAPITTMWARDRRELKTPEQVEAIQAALTDGEVA